MKALLALFFLPFAAFAQTTVTIPARVITVPQQVITIPAQTLVVTTTTSPTPPVTCVAPQVLVNGVCTIPVVIPPAAGVAWVFHNGVTTSLFGGDYSFGSGSVSYKIKDPQTGETVVGITGDEGWQPYFTNNDFDTTGYKYVLVSLKPTMAGQRWTTGAESVGDVPVPQSAGMQPFAQYCTAFAVGQWMTCKIPFSVYSIDKNPGLHVYKFAFLQGTDPKPAGQLNWEAKDYGISP